MTRAAGVACPGQSIWRMILNAVKNDTSPRGHSILCHLFVSMALSVTEGMAVAYDLEQALFLLANKLD